MNYAGFKFGYGTLKKLLIWNQTEFYSVKRNDITAVTYIFIDFVNSIKIGLFF